MSEIVTIMIIKVTVIIVIVMALIIILEIVFIIIIFALLNSMKCYLSTLNVYIVNLCGNSSDPDVPGSNRTLITVWICLG